MDLEGTMTFIMEAQAKFETDIAKIYEAITRLNETAHTHDDAIRGLVDASRRNNDAIHGLVEVSRLQSERLDGLERNLAKSHDRLTRAQKETARRLADFIAQVSRHLAGGNGRGRGPKKPGTK